MRLAERQKRLDRLLLAFQPLWQPQPFRERVPAWSRDWPALAAELLELPEAAVSQLNGDGKQALAMLARHLPEVGEIASLLDVGEFQHCQQGEHGAFWDWEIPGRKRAQIEAFATAVPASGQAVLDWCGGKGHLGRLLAQEWQVPVCSLDFDVALCEEGRLLAKRLGVDQQFVSADALQVNCLPKPVGHAVALHACGELHRHLIRQSLRQDLPALDVAPCCYYRGVETHYSPFCDGLQLQLTRDDTRLAVTETVTATARETRLRDQALAWKLGFDAWRRDAGNGEYRNFKPVADRWLRASFAECMAYLCERESLPALPASLCATYEAKGWQRRHEVMRYSIVRHAFRRAMELWLVLDLAVKLENHGYSVALGCFCERRLTPRNLLISARR